MELVKLPNFSLNWKFWFFFFFCQIYLKREFPVENGKIAILRASMVVTYYIKLFRTGSDRYKGILMSLLLLVAETINLKSSEWPIYCSYNCKRTFVSYRLDHIAKGIKTYSKKYEKILWIGDFNVPFTEANIAAFCNEHKVKALCRLVSNKFSKKFWKHFNIIYYYLFYFISSL